MMKVEIVVMRFEDGERGHKPKIKETTRPLEAANDTAREFTLESLEGRV